MIRFRLCIIAYSAELLFAVRAFIAFQGVPLGGLCPALGRKGLPDPDLDRYIAGHTFNWPAQSTLKIIGLENSKKEIIVAVCAFHRYMKEL